MTRYYLEVRYRVTPVDAVDEHTDAMMDALDVEPNLIDPDIGADLRRGWTDVCAVIEGEDEASALRTGLAAIRSAAWLRRSLGRVRRRPDGRGTIRRTGGVVNRQRLAASGDGDHVLRTGGLYRRPHRTWPVA